MMSVGFADQSYRVDAMQTVGLGLGVANIVPNNKIKKNLDEVVEEHQGNMAHEKMQLCL